MKKNSTTLAEVITYLEDIIEARSISIEDTYTSSLLKKSIARISQKVGEEAVEVVIEAKDNNEKLFKNEVADLLYHTLILMKAKGVGLNDIEKVLSSRKNSSR